MDEKICTIQDSRLIDRSVMMKMEQCAEFIARMIEKYGQEVLAEIEAEEPDENA